MCPTCGTGAEEVKRKYGISRAGTVDGCDPDNCLDAEN